MVYLLSRIAIILVKKQHTIALQMLHLQLYLISVKIEFHSAENRVNLFRWLTLVVTNLLSIVALFLDQNDPHTKIGHHYKK
jgi:hypothetical protein